MFLFQKYFSPHNQNIFFQEFFQDNLFYLRLENYKGNIVFENHLTSSIFYEILLMETENIEKSLKIVFFLDLALYRIIETFLPSRIMS